jgi:hypothetical protein
MATRLTDSTRHWGLVERFLRQDEGNPMHTHRLFGPQIKHELHRITASQT